MLINTSESGFSSVALPRSRSQSMSAASRIADFKPLSRPRAEPEIGSSSTLNEAEAWASSSGTKELNARENENLLQNTKRVSFASAVDLGEASQVTNHGENLNPARDGVFARVQRILYEGVAPVGIGLAVGAGIAELANSTIFHSTTIKSLDEVDDSINIIG